MSSAPGSTLAIDSGAIVRNRVVTVRILHDGSEYQLDSFLFEGQPKKYITVGSHPNSDIRLHDPAVSRNHCLIEQGRRDPIIRDCGSKNGIWINGMPVDEYTLIPGTVVVIGATQILAAGMSGKVRIAGANVGSFVHNAYIIFGRNVRVAASALGMPKSTLWDWIHRKFSKDPEA